MLKQLYIQNFTLIDEMNILFHPGFSVITGETGAGKSIILGALGLLKATVPIPNKLDKERNAALLRLILIFGNMTSKISS